MANTLELISADYNVNTDLVHPKELYALDLDVLSRNFKLDTITKEVNGIKEFFTSNNSINFTKIKYSKKEKTEAEEVYNRPPIGPIDTGFTCIACGNYSPNHHETDCINPNKTSLRLNYKGLQNLIIDIDKTTLINNINDLRRDKTILENFIEEHFVDTQNDSPSDLNFFDVVPIKGSEKTPYKTAKTAFNNTLFITYTNETNTNIDKTERNSNIRIYPSGFIDIKGAPLNQIELRGMLNELIRRINATKSLNLINFNKILRINGIQPSSQFVALDDYSYYTVIRTQFYLFDKKQTEQVIDLEELNIAMANKFVNTNEFVLKETKLNVDTLSKVGNKIKDSLIYKFSLPQKGKLTLQISRFGTFQFTASNDYLVPLEDNLRIMNTLKEFFNNLSEEQFTKENLETKVKLYDKTETTISGLVPPKSKSQKAGTETCAKNQAGIPIRPEPYNWGGKCPVDGYFIPPLGKQGGDITETLNGREQQLFFPCCKKLSQNDRREYKLYLLNGFPISQNIANEYGIFKSHDALSGVLTKNPEPGEIVSAKTPDSNWENPIWIKAKIISVNKGKPISYKAINLATNEVIKILRTNLKRDSRRFKGLNDLNKNELIQILRKNNMIGQPNRENTESIETINLKKVNKYVITNDFIEKQFVVGGVPGNSELVYLVNTTTNPSKTEQFLVDQDNRIIKNTNFRLNSNGIIIGFYDGFTFYAITLKGNTINTDLDTIINDPLIKIVQFYENIIKETYLMLNNEPDTKLLFIERDTYLDEIYFFYKNSIPDTLTVQLLSGRDSTFLLGYKNNPFNDREIYIDKIPKSNKLSPKVGEYINVNPNINIIKDEVLKNRPFIYVSKSENVYLTYEHAKSIYNSVFNPITLEDFDNQEVWEFDNKTLIFENGKFQLEV